MKFTVSYKKNEVYQTIAIEAKDEATATAYFKDYKPTAEYIGIREGMENKPGLPLVIVSDDYEVKTATVDIDELKEGLNTGDYGEYLNDYRDSSSYICDAIAEIADNNTSIYYSDILDFIRDNPDSLAEVVNEGLYEVGHGQKYDLHKHGQAAQYMTIERDIYNHLADSIYLAALDFIRYELELTEIPEELADIIRDYADREETNDRMSDICDTIREYLEA